MDPAKPASGLGWVAAGWSIAPWATLPSAVFTLEVSLLVPVHVPRPVEWVRRAMAPTIAFLRERWGASFEVILAPCGPVGVGDDLGYSLGNLAAPGTPLQLLPTIPAGGDVHGLALRAAFLKSRGRVLFTLNLEQPCDPAFFQRAFDEVSKGIDLVHANRRMPESRFRIPVRVLPFVYARHRLGLAFNRLVKLLLPVATTDTHAGNLAMSRRMATEGFALQRFPGFLFDVELSVIASTLSMGQKDLPERLYLSEEKPSSRVFRETVTIAWRLPILWWRFLRGLYAPMGRAPEAITADDWGISPAVNEGILELAKQGVVRRVSILADSEHLRHQLAPLLALASEGRVALGLHFNLTYGSAIAEGPGSLIRRWMMTRGERKMQLKAEVRGELQRQLGVLHAAGVRATYLDGHHHAHIVPGVLETIADLLQGVGIKEVRLPYDTSLWFSRLAPLNVLAILSRGTLRRHGFRFRPVVYPQRKHFLDQGRLRALLARNPRAEVIVHPAVADDFAAFGVSDPYSGGRVTEYRALQMLGTATSGEQPLVPKRD